MYILINGRWPSIRMSSSRGHSHKYHHCYYLQCFAYSILKSLAIIIFHSFTCLGRLLLLSIVLSFFFNHLNRHLRFDYKLHQVRIRSNYMKRKKIIQSSYVNRTTNVKIIYSFIFFSFPPLHTRLLNDNLWFIYIKVSNKKLTIIESLFLSFFRFFYFSFTPNC
jgi:hypothetical protein